MKKRTKAIHDSVKKYMAIIHTTIKDMAPKYIILSLIQAVSYINPTDKVG